MIVLFFTLIILIFLIVLSQMNPGVITINFLGLVIKNIPISFFMLMFIIIGILWTTSVFAIKYYRLKKQHKDLVNSIINKRTDK
ncbi:MAG: hypothetical protein PHQ32_07085 [Firmicutes bacterium]|nr:hypothetical protein [Bacillota bacterium]